MQLGSWPSVADEPDGEEETTQVVKLSADVAQVATADKRDRCTLTMLAGGHIGTMHALDGDEAVLGRGSAVKVRVRDDGLSRQHARLFREGEHWWIEDLGSTNGTFVSGQRVLTPHRLVDGDRIQMGQNTLFKVSLQDGVEQETSRRLYEGAVMDPLTRVHNRRYLDERLAGELAYAQRHRAQLSVLLFDVDHFKRINDSLGHLAGDAVLRVMAGMVQRMVRTEDLVARYGGEEFAVVARGIDQRNATILAERVRRLVAGLAIPWEGRSIHVTVSVGVATHGAAARYETVSALMTAADEALYRAKHSGRNRVDSA